MGDRSTADTFWLCPFSSGLGVSSPSLSRPGFPPPPPPPPQASSRTMCKSAAWLQRGVGPSPTSFLARRPRARAASAPLGLARPLGDASSTSLGWGGWRGAGPFCPAQVAGGGFLRPLGGAGASPRPWAGWSVCCPGRWREARAGGGRQAGRQAGRAPMAERQCCGCRWEGGMPVLRPAVSRAGSGAGRGGAGRGSQLRAPCQGRAG